MRSRRLKVDIRRGAQADWRCAPRSRSLRWAVLGLPYLYRLLEDQETWVSICDSLAESHTVGMILRALNISAAGAEASIPYNLAIVRDAACRRCPSKHLRKHSICGIWLIIMHILETPPGPSFLGTCVGDEAPPDSLYDNGGARNERAPGLDT